jgi:hypothetical protein
MEAKRTELITEVVDGLKTLTDEAVVDLLVVRLEANSEVHGPGEGHPGPLIEGLIKARPTLAHAMLENLRSTPAPSGLDPVLPVILGAFAVHDPGTALEEAKKLLGGASIDRRRAAAQAIGWNRGPRGLYPGELDLLVELASDADVVIRQNVVRAAQLVARTLPAEATRLLAAIRFSDDKNLADDFFMAFRLEYGISWSNFSESELNQIRQDLVAVPSIGEYSVSKALADRSATDPVWVVGLLLERIELADSLDSIRGYDALPYSWDNQLRIRDTSAFISSLNGILNWIAEDPGTGLRRKLAAELFSAVAVTFDSQVVNLLTKALATATEKMTLAVVAVLQGAPRTFIWDEPDFVRSALHAAAKLGEDLETDMIDALRGVTIFGSRIGTPGEPFPETIEQRDRSRAIAKDLPTGSIEKQFYTNIAKSAERDILRESEDDFPSDGRPW